MSAMTAALARELVHLDEQIKLAAEDHRWDNASELEYARAAILWARYTALRTVWRERAQFAEVA